MTHAINGFIGPVEELQRLTTGLVHAKVCKLRVFGLGFLPSTYELSAEMGRRWYDLGKHAQVPIIHVETNYFGGFGDQSAAVWKGGRKWYRDKSSTGSPISYALSQIGVKAEEGMDEFDTIGLGCYRTNEDWYNSGGVGNPDFPDKGAGI